MVVSFFFFFFFWSFTVYGAKDANEISHAPTVRKIELLCLLLDCRNALLMLWGERLNGEKGGGSILLPHSHFLSLIRIPAKWMDQGAPSSLPPQCQAAAGRHRREINHCKAAKEVYLHFCVRLTLVWIIGDPLPDFLLLSIQYSEEKWWLKTFETCGFGCDSLPSSVNIWRLRLPVTCTFHSCQNCGWSIISFFFLWFTFSLSSFSTLSWRHRWEHFSGLVCFGFMGSPERAERRPTIPHSHFTSSIVRVAPSGLWEHVGGFKELFNHPVVVLHHARRKRLKSNFTSGSNSLNKFSLLN